MRNRGFAAPGWPFVSFHAFFSSFFFFFLAAVAAIVSPEPLGEAIECGMTKGHACSFTRGREMFWGREVPAQTQGGENRRKSLEVIRFVFVIRFSFFLSFFPSTVFFYRCAW